MYAGSIFVHVWKSWNLKLFSQNLRGYLKNYWTKYRLFCSQINAFFMLNPNMAMKIWISKKNEKSLKILACRLHSTSAWRGLSFLTLLYLYYVNFHETKKGDKHFKWYMIYHVEVDVILIIHFESLHSVERNTGSIPDQ